MTAVASRQRTSAWLGKTAVIRSQETEHPRRGWPESRAATLATRRSRASLRRTTCLPQRRERGPAACSHSTSSSHATVAAGPYPHDRRPCPGPEGPICDAAMVGARSAALPSIVERASGNPCPAGPHAAHHHWRHPPWSVRMGPRNSAVYVRRVAYQMPPAQPRTAPTFPRPSSITGSGSVSSPTKPSGPSARNAINASSPPGPLTSFAA